MVFFCLFLAFFPYSLQYFASNHHTILNSVQGVFFVEFLVLHFELWVLAEGLSGHRQSSFLLSSSHLSCWNANKTWFSRCFFHLFNVEKPENIEKKIIVLWYIADPGGSRSTMVACWTTGQQVEWLMLHLGHDSYQFISVAQVAPAKYNLTSADSWPKTPFISFPYSGKQHQKQNKHVPFREASLSQKTPHSPTNASLH